MSVPYFEQLHVVDVEHESENFDLLDLQDSSSEDLGCV